MRILEKVLSYEAIIKSNYECLPVTIIHLQKQGKALLEAIHIFLDISAEFSNLKGKTATINVTFSVHFLYTKIYWRQTEEYKEIFNFPMQFLF